MVRSTVMQCDTRKVVGGAQTAAAGPDSLQRLVLKFAQAVESHLRSPALNKFDQVRANQGRNRSASLRSLDAGEPVGLFI